MQLGLNRVSEWKKELPTHYGTLAWKIQGMEDPGRLQSMGSHRFGHDWSNLAAAAAESLSWIEKKKNWISKVKFQLCRWPWLWLGTNQPLRNLISSPVGWGCEVEYSSGVLPAHHIYKLMMLLFSPDSAFPTHVAHSSCPLSTLSPPSHTRCLSRPPLVLAPYVWWDRSQNPLTLSSSTVSPWYSLEIISYFMSNELSSHLQKIPHGIFLPKSQLYPEPLFTMWKCICACKIHNNNTHHQHILIVQNLSGLIISSTFLNNPIL